MPRPGAPGLKKSINEKKKDEHRARDREAEGERKK